MAAGKEPADNKLLLLYILDKLGLEVSNLQITKIILEHKYMNYFTLQEQLGELCRNKHLNCMQKDGKMFYSLTKLGRESIECLSNLIPVGIRKNIDSGIGTEKRKIRNEISISSDFIPVNENEYTAILKVDESDFNLMELRLTVGSRKDARDICENWKKNSQNIYPEILEILTKKDYS